jgi:hypothetical protein
VSVLWLRRADGTLIMRAVNPVADGPCSWEREAAGESVVKLRLIGDDETGDPVEPCTVFLLHASPTDGRFCKTWWDTDVEIAWWRDDAAADYVADTIPEVAPTWAGPIVAASLESDGFLTVRAWSQEAYLIRSTVGDELLNYLITGGVGDYRFSSDTALDDWSEHSGVTDSTTNTGSMWLDDTYSALVEASDAREGIYATALVPDSTSGNYATATVAVYVPSGTSLWDDETRVVASVELYVDTDLEEIWDLVLPEGWAFDTWYPVSVQVRQPPGTGVSYTFFLFGGDNGPVRFGRPMFTRPANVGAVAGSDVAQVPAAILDEQVDLVPALTGYDTDPVSIDLAESFRYFSVDHEDAAQTLGDWSGFGEWWVSEGTAYWRPERGVLIDAFTLDTAEDMAGWSIEVDASGASNRLYGQVRPEGGAAYEVAVGDGTPNRLVAVAQVPAGMGPGDAPEWCDAALAQKVPRVSLTGVPVEYESLPGEELGSFMPGNWMDVTIAPLSLTVQPTVDSVTWDPVSDEVRPSWVLGGDARQDPLELITAALKASERAQRVYRPLPQRANLGGRLVEESSDLSGSPPGANLSMDLPAGTWTVWAGQSQTGASGGTYYCNIFEDHPTDPGGYSQIGHERVVSYFTVCKSPPITVRGPTTVGAFGRSDLTGTLTDRRITIYAERTGE